jgi:succinyl-CoA synthetase beta subunit
MSDPRVKAILINIFGGIVRCDRVAQGVIDAAREIKINIPVVVRLEGTNAREAATLLHQAKMNFIVADSIQQAAEKVVEALPSAVGDSQ